MRLSIIGLVLLAACSKLIDLEDVTYGGDPPAPTCSDGLRNGEEADVDCGGPSCGPCGIGAACASGGDCATQSCQRMVCEMAACTDEVSNGDETDVDCGGSCGPCGDGKVCRDPADCTSRACVTAVCQVASCTDRIQNGTETDVDCGGAGCGACELGSACAADRDCARGGICDTRICRTASSCAEIVLHFPGSPDGVYSIAPTAAAPFSVVCDMTRDGGGWTLLLKANGDATLGYNAPAWTDTSLLNPADLTIAPGNAKYQSYVSLPVSILRGELDGFRYTQAFAHAIVAQQIFAGGSVVVREFPTFNTGAPNWSTQPNCHTFGVNTMDGFAMTRFGWSANQEPDCLTNDTAIGLGLVTTISPAARGAGYECLSTECSAGNVDAGGNGLLWAK